MNISFISQPISIAIRLPASKSISNRVLVLDELSHKQFPITNLSDSDDTLVLKEALEFIRHNAGGNIDVGSAGTSFRFLTTYLSQMPGEWILTGDERMKQRPIEALVEALNELGATIRYLEEEGFPPLRISGRKLKGGSVTIDAGISSQFISALLMMAPLMEEGLSLKLSGRLISEPYIRMTLALMEQFGINHSWKDKHITVSPQEFRPVPATIESDWSAASYWYEIAALSKKEVHILLKGLRQDSLQGDSKVEQLFKPLGVNSLFTDEGLALQKQKTSYPEQIEYDFGNEPDLVQTLVITCCLLDIPFHFTGLQSLRIKETDRIEALEQEMKKLGYMLIASDTALSWNGSRCEADINPIISTYNDHRMAMAFAPAALLTDGLIIDNPLVVSKSYPYFWDDLRRAGFEIQDLRFKI